jgi:hypothetical protein
VADPNDFGNARKAQGKSASTLRHDVHPIRSMINRVRKTWNSQELRATREHGIDFPALPPGVTRCFHPSAREDLRARVRALSD